MLKSKKFFALAVCVFMLASCGVAFAEYHDDNTGDSWDDAYIIDSVADLKLMRDRVNNGTYWVLNLTPCPNSF